jgi:hypothetical protein
MKKLIVLILLLLSVGTTYAQKYVFGIIQIAYADKVDGVPQKYTDWVYGYGTITVDLSKEVIVIKFKDNTFTTKIISSNYASNQITYIAYISGDIVEYLITFHDDGATSILFDTSDYRVLHMVKQLE